MSWFKPHYLPMLLIVIDVLATIGYVAHGDIRRTIYWAAAAVLTASVTF